MVQMPTHGVGPMPHKTPHGCTLGHGSHRIDGRLGIAKRNDAGIHGHGQRHPRVHGVQTDVVTQKVQTGDGVEVIDAGHGTHGPKRLIL